jgi:hypothetical protein
MAYYMELAPGDTLVVGDGTRISVERKSGQRTRLKIESDQDVERIKAGEPVPPRESSASTKQSPAPVPSAGGQAAQPGTPWLQRRSTLG